MQLIGSPVIERIFCSLSANSRWYIVRVISGVGIAAANPIVSSNVRFLTLNFSIVFSFSAKIYNRPAKI